MSRADHSVARYDSRSEVGLHLLVAGTKGSFLSFIIRVMDLSSIHSSFYLPRTLCIMLDITHFAVPATATLRTRSLNLRDNINNDCG